MAVDMCGLKGAAGLLSSQPLPSLEKPGGGHWPSSVGRMKLLLLNPKMGENKTSIVSLLNEGRSNPGFLWLPVALHKAPSGKKLAVPRHSVIGSMCPHHLGSSPLCLCNFQMLAAISCHFPVLSLRQEE